MLKRAVQLVSHTLYDLLLGAQKVKIFFFPKKKSNDLNWKSLKFPSKADVNGFSTSSSKPLKTTSLATDLHVKNVTSTFFPASCHRD